MRNIEDSPDAAASIHHNPKNWQDIKGIQMEGVVNDGGTGPQAIAAFGLYLKRFAFSGNLPYQPFTNSLNSFKEQFNVNWYAFMPHRLVYVDNSIEFGYKLQLNADLDVCR